MRSQRVEEGLGEAFDLKSYQAAQQLTTEICHELAHSLTPGIYEKEAHQLFKAIQKKHGIAKLWHPTKIRFGKNTLCKFSDPGGPDQRLHEGELFIVDVGPIVNGHEGDYGETYRCGGGGDALISASKQIFKLTEEAWSKAQLTGPELYEVAHKAAENLGLKLSKHMHGHRLGDFPHHLFHKGDLGRFKHTPAAGLWVLEIHVVDEARERAAFFEDILGLGAISKIDV